MSADRLILGDSLKVLPTLPEGCADAVVTDPPAGISFMGKTWDTFPLRRRDLKANRGGVKDGKHPRGFGKCDRDGFIAFLSAVMAEALRCLKPGGYALVWALPRTSHWTGTALEDAGFEIRDRISHLFGQGFPKGQGCLKPACEDWWLCRKPGRRVLPLGIEECRIGTNAGWAYPNGPGGSEPHHMERGQPKGNGRQPQVATAGRWPANLCLSHHPSCNGACHPECPVRLLDEQSGTSKSSGGKTGRVGCGGRYNGGWSSENPGETAGGFGDTGGASRFFYVAKASRRDRGEGNTHPTVKSTALMRWMVKLVAREGETVLDPFAGSGSTLVACVQTGRRFVGVEQDPESVLTANRRIAATVAAREDF